MAEEQGVAVDRPCLEKRDSTSKFEWFVYSLVTRSHYIIPRTDPFALL